jgi:hypothetical protein
MALSIERNPLTVVLGPPGTGKTYTIANLIGHLLSQGKRVLVCAEKEEALHEVRGKVIEELRPMVVPVMAGTADDKTRLAQAIAEIGGLRSRDLQDRIAAVSAERDRWEQLSRRRSELLNSLSAAWETERGLLVEAGDYAGTVEQVADEVAAAREAYGWLTDRPDRPALDLG